AGQTFNRVRLGAAVQSAQSSAARRQLSGLGFDNAQIVLLRERPIVALDGLVQLAFADAVGSLADEPAGAGINRAGQVERVGKQVIAQQNAGRIAPAGVDGGGVAADVGLVEHVVVNQGGRMD